MSFIEILKDLIDRTSGAYAATIMDKDGVPIADYKREGEDCDVEAVGVEYGRTIKEIKSASEVLNLGEVDEISIASHGTNILLRMVSRDYFMAVILAPGANMGKARYLLRRASRRAVKELA